MSRSLCTWLLLAGTLSAGCALFDRRVGPDPERADEIVAEAVERAKRGDVPAALAYVDEEFGPEQEADVAFLRHYALGWLRDEASEAAASAAARASELELAAAEYRAALELRPGEAEVSDNLAGVLRRLERYEEALAALQAVAEDTSTAEGRERAYLRRLAIGDLRLDMDDLDGALAEYERARAELPSREEAPLRIVVAYSFFAAEREGWEPALEAACVTFAANGTSHVARRGYELLAFRSVETGDVELGTRTLEAWLRLEAKAATLSRESLDRLPPLTVWPNTELAQLHRLVAYAEQGPPPEETAGTPHVTLEAADLTDWLNSTPARRQIIVLATESLALRRAVAADYATAADLYWFAVLQAPPFVMYEAEGPLANERPIALLDIAPDLCLLLQNHREDLPDTPLTVEDVVARVRPTLANDTRVLAVDPAGLQRFYTVLGLVFAERGAWAEDPFDDPWLQAPAYLRRAIEVARSNPAQPVGPNGEPLPQLSRILAAGLARTEDGREAAVEAWFGAALGFHDQDDRSLAIESFESGEELAAVLNRSVDDEVDDTREKLGVRRGGFFPRNWLDGGYYVAGGIMHFDSQEDAGDVDSALAALGHTTSTSFDGTVTGGKLLLGYEFEGPFALELGYTNMGEIESQITAFAPVLPSLAADIEKVHPVLGDGFTAALRTTVWGGGAATVTARLGAWVWDANKDLKIATPSGTQIGKLDEEGIDFFYGLGVIFGGWGGFRGTVEYERYFLDGDGVDSLTLGAIYGFGQ